MDKNTLSNYGWIVVAILILSVMIALATPFGSYVQRGTQNTLNGLIDVNNEAINLDNFYGENWEYRMLKDYHGGLFVPNTDSFVLLDTEDGKVEANWYNLVVYDFLKFESGVLGNGSRVSELEGELRISKEVASIMGEEWDSSSVFLHNARITSVVLLDGITKIGSWAFSQMPELTTITIPASVETIGGGFARNCLKLDTIIVDENNENFVSIDNVLYTKDKKELVKYPNAKPETTYHIIDECDTLRAHSFYKTKFLENIYFNENLTTVKAQVFEESNSIKNIYINKNLKTVNGAWIRSAKNVILHINDENKNLKVIDNVLYDYDLTTLIGSGYQDDSTIVIPDTVTRIMIICNRIKNITIPENLKIIDEAALASAVTLSDKNLNIIFKGNEKQWEKINIIDREINGEYSNTNILSLSTITFEK